jgi:acyl-CoA thioester hydrolase
MNRVNLHVSRIAMYSTKRKLMEQWTYPYSESVAVAFRDIDALGHVNNAVYLSYFEQARIGYSFRLMNGATLNDLTFILAEANVAYLRPTYFGDQLEVGVRVSEIGTKSFVMEYGLRNQHGEIVARGRTVQVWFDYAARCSMPVPDEFRRKVAEDNAKVKD